MISVLDCNSHDFCICNLQVAILLSVRLYVFMCVLDASAE